MVCQTGGGIIRRKLFLSVLLLFGLALVLNVNTTAAATTNNTTITTSNNTVTTTAITNSTVKATTKTVAKPEPKITSINPVGNAIVSKSQNIKITYNETIKAGSMWIVLTNSAGTVISTKDVISGKTLTIKPVKALVSGVKYLLSVHTNSIEDLSGDGTSVFSTSFTVSPITLAQMKDGITRAEKFDTTNKRLPKYVSYGKTKIPIAEFKKIIATQGLKIGVTGTAKSVATVAKTVTVKAAAATPSTVDGLTLAQVKDGLTRAQSFAILNGRLPTYVSYGSKHILIAQFEQILKSEGLNIVGNANRPIYITSDNITNTVADNARINSIIAGLKALGLTAYNMGLGPNTHDSVLTSGNLPSNAVVVDLYGGADAGVIKEMGSAWYKSIKGARTVFSVFWPPSADITGLAFLPRAHDDNYDPTSFTGIANPAQYLLDNGYDYIHSGVLLNVINAIFYLDKL